MSTPQELLGQVLPRYDIRHEIGRGAWGVVYEGWHRDLRRPVAIKQLPKAFGIDPLVRDRFIAEAQLVASLEHPHIVPLFDFAERDGVYVIVMELATGSVWNRFDQQGMQTDEAVATVLASAVGLHYAHTRGVLHRDVKLDNILYSASGTVKIADFGIAKSMNQAGGIGTATNTIVGSPAYMAPEQIVGGELSAATDVYALGIATYELLSGHLPFAPVTEVMARLYQHVNEPPRSLTELAPHLPAALAEVTHRAISKDPHDRPASAEQFAIELAGAGATSFGVGWLERTGLAVMGSTAVIAATERAPTSPHRSGETVLVRPDEIERLQHGQVKAEAVAPAGTAPPAQPGNGAAKTAGITSSGAESAGAERRQGHKRPRAAVMAVAGILTTVLVVALVIVASGGGDTETPIAEPITAGEQATFRSMCNANSVGDERCGCALSRAVGQLDPDVFRTNLATMMEQNGALGPELNTIFQSCVDDGF